VLPKIEASRDADAPAVEEVVVKVAERNPQKLRQIGLNYDIANAKGASELTEEQKKKHEQKKREAAEKKKKKKKKKAEEEAKEKEDFENWKKDEKADYEAWKRERARQINAAPKDDDGKAGTKDDDSKPEKKDAEAKDEPKPDADEAVEIKVEAPTPSTVAEGKTVEAEEIKIDALSPSTVADEKPEVKGKPITTEPGKNDTNIDLKPEDNDDEVRIPPDTDDVHPPHYAVSHGPPSMLNGPGPYSRHPGSVYGEPAPPAPRSTRGAADNTPKTWNAVCVLGLRVYSQDPSVSIKLVKPKDVEEGAILDVDGGTMAGATM
jgi:hypothetical protein